MMKKFYFTIEDIKRQIELYGYAWDGKVDANGKTVDDRDIMLAAPWDYIISLSVLNKNSDKYEYKQIRVNNDQLYVYDLAPDTHIVFDMEAEIECTDDWMLLVASNHPESLPDYERDARESVENLSERYYETREQYAEAVSRAKLLDNRLGDYARALNYQERRHKVFLELIEKYAEDSKEGNK